jgi:hypothetical protein
LVAVGHKNILFGCEGRLELNCTVVEEPGQVPILILVLVELLKLRGTILHFRG